MRKVTVNRREPVTRKSKHRAISSLDVCLTPSPLGMVPIPYVNVAQSRRLRRGSCHVRIDGAAVMLAGSTLKPSTGNEAGTGGGIVSHATRGPAHALTFSPLVRIEGKGVVRKGDATVQNGGNCVGRITQ